MSEKLIGESHRNHNNTFIRGTIPGVSVGCEITIPLYWPRWDVCYLEQKVSNMEIEIITLVVTDSANLTVPPDGQEQIQVGSRSVALRGDFDLKLSGSSAEILKFEIQLNTSAI